MISPISVVNPVEVAIFIRNVDGEFNTTDELAPVLPLKRTTKSRHLLEAVQSTLNRF